MSCLQQNWRTRGWSSFCPEEGWWQEKGVAQTMCTHLSKCKNDEKKIQWYFFREAKAGVSCECRSLRTIWATKGDYVS
jgi:hypothetical protein